MSITIPANDHGRIRVFTVDGALPDGVDTGDAQALDRLLGTTNINPDFVDVVRVRDLSGLSLADYIAQGYDLTVDDVDRSALSKVNDVAILVMSRAFGGKAADITPAQGAHHLTTISDQPSLSAAPPVTSASASGAIGDPPQKAPPSDAAMSGRVATIAIVVLLLIVIGVIWIAM